MKKLLAVSAMMLLASVPIVAQITAAKKAVPSATGVLDQTPAAGVAQGGVPMEKATPQRGYCSGRFLLEGEGIAQSSTILSVRDAASGLPTGKRMHKPYVITKEIDSASPLLMRAMTSHQAISGLEIVYSNAAVPSGARYDLKPGKGGKVSMQDIAITKIQKISPTTEEITIEYAAITFTNSKGGITSEDDWSSPK